ncbi:hypothetical protein BO82DRAFT_421433 [Aspergillus uvarum CBS 121591]|uniref:D-isomer specific 2-hydroxyacid dehydrogenase NAD-binding domain-containing protein n=1 Tax=Aspergillus uvarum CBS 121591 TaxID=1448315 RepID=A0A319C0M5_9EURO|nr:hypothetical protein BO82DRAFT_421433 [Aspergillus uvarum CBS 121591]PYH78624.1 hypothetical protein BO82DRAFT_421433 [Aspergillus uvarum CBS 121591]
MHWRQNAKALLNRGSYVTAADIASCPKLVAIGKHGEGIDNVARGIRSITTQQMAKPVPKEMCNGRTVHGRFIGIIGMGNFGRTVAEIFYGGNNARIVAYDAYMPATGVWEHLPHIRAQSVEEVITQADVLSLHLPLTKETRGMLSYAEIKQMKPDAILINAARGDIVDEAGLERALSKGHIWGAGLNCHEQEPPSREKYGAF